METTEARVNDKEKGKTDSTWPALVIFFTFFIWGYYYLFTLRPILNSYLAGSITSYPAFLHLIPIFSVPMACGLLVDFALRISKKK
ncbi:hypothetical protein ACO0LC_26940 [Undibacterium sp. JH2W]|uniref:hypothetical protein n=1 Tax=Undibacterium sp. JH2W TaxID=3413037 RepID=UPI003BF0FB27